MNLMYASLKKAIKALLPQNFIIKHEMKFRGIYYLFFRGVNFYCNVCKHGLKRFISEIDDDKLCPRCGSLARNRRLYDLLQKEYLNKNIKILDFSPSRNLYRILKGNKTITYISTDFSGEFFADYHYDITNLDLPDNSIDLIICYHILEHIADDAKAMFELYRVLKTGGKCIIQTPFKEGDIYENKSIQTSEERLKHFGQVDHVRIYSVDGLQDRLSVAGFDVEIKEFSELPNNEYGYKQKEFVLIGKKSKDALTK